MKVCVSCECHFVSNDWKCIQCGFEPPEIQGCICFAPEIGQNSNVYDPNHIADADEFGPENYWYAARSRLIVWATKHYFPDAANFLEIGCGSGKLLKKLEEENPRLNLTGLELFLQGLLLSEKREGGPELLQGDARNLPFDSEFDIVGAFDVIEHIEDDEAVIGHMYKAVKTGGGMLMTVPQHPFLWSERDRALFHKRRYTRNELTEKVTKAGFEICMVTSFISLPFPAMILLAFRNRKRRPDYKPIQDAKSGRLTNFLLDRILRLEMRFIENGYSFPVGGSLFIVARKR